MHEIHNMNEQCELYTVNTVNYNNKLLIIEPLNE